MVTIERTAWGGWPNCYRIANGEVELILTSDVGPRIMRYAFTGGQNLLKEFADQLGRSGEAEWQLRGGHRIWIAPEDPVKTYAPDNGPVGIRIEGGVIEATEPVEERTGIEKQISVRLAESGAAVEIGHRLRNAGKQPFELAPWALSMMAPGGHGIHAFPPRGTHPEMLLPTNPLVMWAFTHLDDPRWIMTRRYLVLRQDASNPVPQKLGAHNRHTWAGYLLNNELFVKRYETPWSVSCHPDFGCSFEMFTNADFLELETLGPVMRLAPGESIVHVEHWSLHRDVHVESWTDAGIHAAIGALIA